MRKLLSPSYKNTITAYVKIFTMSDTNPRSEDGIIERYPHYKTYKACQSQALVSSSFALIMTTACSYLVMDVVYRKLKFGVSKNWLVAGPVCFGVLSAYVVVQHKTINCQNMWMAMEEKHSVLTPARERLAMREKVSTNSSSIQ